LEFHGATAGAAGTGGLAYYVVIYVDFSVLTVVCAFAGVLASLLLWRFISLWLVLC
jgi:hypothetical protein